MEGTIVATAFLEPLIRRLVPAEEARNTGGGYAGYFAGNLYAGGNLVLGTGSNPRLYAAAAGGEQNRYLNLLNSPTSPSASRP